MHGSPGDLYVVFMCASIKSLYVKAMMRWSSLFLCSGCFGYRAGSTYFGRQGTHKIPEGTQTGTVFRLRGQRYSHLRLVPRSACQSDCTSAKKLTAKQKELLREFARSPEKMWRAAKGFFDKMKDAFMASKGRYCAMAGINHPTEQISIEAVANKLVELGAGVLPFRNTTILSVPKRKAWVTCFRPR